MAQGRAMRISGSVSTILIPLAMNAGVGLVSLLLLLTWRSGFCAFYEAASVFRVWNILPGILGSFFVFASIMGYQRLGAASTIAVLIASQLLFGLLVDFAKPGGMHGQETTLLIGAAMLVIGAALVAYRVRG